MAFHGLFVGIDRFASPKINWLSCAKRDAVALHALFSDTLGKGAELLVDGEATRATIESALEKLQRCADEDIVVLAFSGHGSQTHQLVTHDSDPARLAETSISLEALSAYLGRIPAKRLVCFLDCCFSGGLGAKVLRVDTLPRDMDSIDTLLDRLSGTGRIILTASTATQPAWENQRLGHGLLTFFLLEALQGAPEVVQAGKISIYPLLQHVTQRVIAEATKLGKPQQPTVRGQIDGELTWPVFRAGSLYRAAFPERLKPVVTSEVQSLSAYGFPPELLKAWAAAIPSLNEMQIQAINDFNLLEGQHLLVSAPTSSGKTMIGELAALKGAIERKRALFLLPLRALVNDKHQYFRRIYGEFGLRTIRATGEITDDIPDLMRGRFDVCLMTYEKFAALVLAAPHILEQVRTIVIDEVQMIADQNRGVNLEFVLTALLMRRREGVEPQIVGLSAVIGDTYGFDRWLNARLLRRNERPVPLHEGILCANGDFRYVDPASKEKRLPGFSRPEYRKGSSQDYVIPLVRKLVSERKQVLVFRETKGEARGCALYLAEALCLPPAQSALVALPAGDPSRASEDLRKALAGGVAFHTADLERDERLVIEQAFRMRDSALRVIVATTTLAMGINTPAEAVVIVGLEHPGETATPYSIAEYKNMVGRAGRLGFSDHGTSFLITTSQADEYSLWERYVKGVPENLVSRFLSADTDPRSLIIRVLAAGRRIAGRALTTENVVEFLHASFGAFLQRQIQSTWQWDKQRLIEAMGELEKHGLIVRQDGGGYQLTPLGRFAGEAGIEVESVIRLVEALRNIPADNISDPTLIAATQVTIELDNVLFPLNRRSTHKEPQQWVGELRQQQVAGDVMRALNFGVTDGHQPTLRAKKAVACLYWISDTPISQIEASLTQFGGAFGGAAGPVRAVASRTSDMLEMVAKIAELTHEGLDLSDRRARLMTRLQVGVSAKCVDITQIFGTNLTRGDYQNLLRSNLISVEAVEAATDEQLHTSFGGATADSENKVGIIRTLLEDRRMRGIDKPQHVVSLPPYEA